MAGCGGFAGIGGWLAGLRPTQVCPEPQHLPSSVSSTNAVVINAMPSPAQLGLRSIVQEAISGSSMHVALGSSSGPVIG